MASNFRFDVTSDNPEHLRVALSLAFSEHDTAVGWKVVKTLPMCDNPVRMMLFWAEPETQNGFTLFPSELSLDAAVAVVRHWLDTCPRTLEPDHDGDNVAGFRVFNEQWGHVSGDRYAFVGIEPAWLEYGK